MLHGQVGKSDFNNEKWRFRHLLLRYCWLTFKNEEVGYYLDRNQFCRQGRTLRTLCRFYTKVWPSLTLTQLLKQHYQLNLATYLMALALRLEANLK